MFGGIDRRTLYIILAVVIVVSIASLGTAGIISMLLTIPGVLVAIGIHEFGHAWMAVKLGDNTPLYQGRLSIDPFKHIDIIGLMMLMFCHIGWGKPVQIDPGNFDVKYRRNGEALVAFAGPMMNFILALILCLIFGAVYKFAGLAFLTTTAGEVVLTMLQYAIIMNIGLGLFNLIPLPPLDGSKIFIRFMSYNVRNWFYENESIFYIIFLVLWISGLAGSLISPALDAIYEAMIKLTMLIFRI